MVTSSAASERAMGFVHLKRRNRVTADEVQKLVFIKNSHQVGIDWGDADDEEEGLNENECIIIDENVSSIEVDE
jgi:hypothetical protein